jgi:hypothetical protein
VLQVRRRLDFGQETLGSDDGGQLRLEDLEGDLSTVLQVVGEVDGGHPAFAELALDAVAVDQGGGEAGGDVGHGRWVEKVAEDPAPAVRWQVEGGWGERHARPAGDTEVEVSGSVLTIPVSTRARYRAFLPRQIPASRSDKNGRSCALPVSWTCSRRDSAMPGIGLQAGGSPVRARVAPLLQDHTPIEVTASGGVWCREPQWP